YLPSRWDFNASTLSPLTSSSVALSSLAFHLKVNLRPTGRNSAAFAFAFPSSSVIVASTVPSFPRAYLHKTRISSSLPCGEIFRTSLSANSSFISPPCKAQTPDGALVSFVSFLSSAAAVRLARARKPKARAKAQRKVFGDVTLDTPLRKDRDRR